VFPRFDGDELFRRVQELGIGVESFCREDWDCCGTEKNYWKLSKQPGLLGLDTPNTKIINCLNLLS